MRHREATEAFSGLVEMHSALVQYFSSVMENISVAQVSAGAAFTVAVTKGGSAWAWGDGSHGQVGQGSLVRRYVRMRESGV
jgi:alpha-tubulin suppressor-like RCC1 family protein